MKYTLLLPALAFALVTSNLPVAAQEAVPCEHRAAPVSVVLPDQRLVRGLKVEDFHARVDGKPISIKVASDSDPRRILLLIDVSRKMNNAAWTATLAAATHVAQNAREEDQLALLTFGGPRVFVDFGEPRSAILGKLSEYATSRPGPAQAAELVRDAMAEALVLFSPPRFGDAILLFFVGEDTGSKISVGKLQDAYSASQVRVFGMVFGVLYQGTYSVTPGPSGFPEASVSYGNPFYDIVIGSGGAIIVGYSGDPQRTFKVNPDLLDQLRVAAWRLYGQIAETYRISFVVPPIEKPKEWGLEVSPELKERFAGLVIRKPKLIHCSSAAPGRMAN